MSVVAVVGLGYVGLPLAVEFGKKRQTIGYDLSATKVESYKRYIDPTGEVSPDDFRAARNFSLPAIRLSYRKPIILLLPFQRLSISLINPIFPR